MTLESRLTSVKLWLSDVDGVLTDGRIILDNAGNESKFFDVRDGHGLVLLRKCGIRVGFITGRTSEVVNLRAKELGAEFVAQGSRDKTQDLMRFIAQAGVSLNVVAYMGDDVVDLPVLLRVGFASAPADAHADVLPHVHHVTKAPGGRGAVREVCEMILKAQGRWDSMLGDWLSV
jgi:3-deoxy-D-manno-octulosonate 8-phosphate phosphatase (KDO 8-P phosphatase)